MSSSPSTVSQMQHRASSGPASASATATASAPTHCQSARACSGPCPSECRKTRACRAECGHRAGDGQHDHAGGGDRDVSAETPGPQPQAAEPAPAVLPFWHPAHEDRCHLDDGPAISPAALALIGCNATISTMIHDLSGAIIDVGRRTRKPPPALRRALRERDRAAASTPAATAAAPTPGGLALR